ncbi:MAG: UDP-N-acetylmuramate dehydrogenase [Cytophagales bacterium]|nr:UDP-N-acetylmuramate dehydrogenase [Cytophagales bacterium]
MKLQENISLKAYNTFGLEVTAQKFGSFTSEDDLKAFFPSQETWFILGGGSNILLTQDFEGIVLHNQIMGIDKIKEDENHIWLEVGAGEVWHNFVLHCIEKEWAGIENLSLIPGTVGASPIQNIGAYGVEVKDVIESVKAFHIETQEIHVFNNKQCEFGYRDSVFKREQKGKYVITQVTFKLNKVPTFNVNYGAIQQTLEENSITELSLKAVSDAVIQIRQSKLPDPKEIGNSGSFFKNPEIPTSQFEALKEKFPNIVGYPVKEGVTKVPAGWLIDNAGWKGKRFGEIGVHAKQALVLVNYGNGKGNDIKELAYKIKADIFEKYGIEINPEVNII